MENCLFCGIANGGRNLIWENEVAAAFRDIHPKAPVHVLVVPKQHIGMLDELDDLDLAGRLMMAVKEIAVQEGVAGAYRVTINNGRAGGQVIDHLHFHVMGGMHFDE